MKLVKTIIIGRIKCKLEFKYIKIWSLKYTEILFNMFGNLKKSNTWPNVNEIIRIIYDIPTACNANKILVFDLAINNLKLIIMDLKQYIYNY